MIFHVLTIFPEYFLSPLSVSFLKRAIERHIITVNLVDIRSYSSDRHRKVDDEIYGAGTGMLFQPEPVARAIENNFEGKNGIRIFLTPSGKVLTQKICEELSSYEEILLLCGRYEGIDQRVIEEYIDLEISAGDFVLPGGESAALIVMECVTRLIPGSVGKEDSVRNDSFTTGLLEGPHYTRPSIWRGKKVPEVLLSGDHGRVEEWRLKEALRKTYHLRPDLLLQKKLSPLEKKLLKEIWYEDWGK